jgi:hypothetical protein
MAADDPGKMMTVMIDRLGAALAARGPRRS